MLDYGARFYDPQIGRWHSEDPMAEIIHNINPYNYCYNNPLSYVDPNGMFSKNYINQTLTSTFILPSGEIIDVRNDNDQNIYLVPDKTKWDGTKKGLAIVGETYDPYAFGGLIGYSIFTAAHLINRTGGGWFTTNGYIYIFEPKENASDELKTKFLEFLGEGLKKAGYLNSLLDLRMKYIKYNKNFVDVLKNIKWVNDGKALKNFSIYLFAANSFYTILSASLSKDDIAKENIIKATLDIIADGAATFGGQLGMALSLTYYLATTQSGPANYTPDLRSPLEQFAVRDATLRRN